MVKIALRYNSWIQSRIAEVLSGITVAQMNIDGGYDDILSRVVMEMTQCQVYMVALLAPPTDTAWTNQQPEDFSSAEGRTERWHCSC